MLECVSSGNCANVAEVYHGSGTRSQRVSGLAECWPMELLASRLVHGWSYDVVSRSSHRVTAETYATQKSCHTAIQLVQRVVRVGRRYAGIGRSYKSRAAWPPLLVVCSEGRSVDRCERCVSKYGHK